MGNPTNAKPFVKPIPGKPNLEFTRRRPMTWNMENNQIEESKNKNFNKIKKTTFDDKNIGSHQLSGKMVFLDEKTKLFYIHDEKSPKNKHYVKKTTIIFSKTE